MRRHSCIHFLFQDHFLVGGDDLGLSRVRARTTTKQQLVGLDISKASLWAKTIIMDGTVKIDERMFYISFTLCYRVVPLSDWKMGLVEWQKFN